jgi:Carboxypeptidase regulatory-like domain/TonB-dependent Receptor Plug Domain
VTHPCILFGPGLTRSNGLSATFGGVIHSRSGTRDHVLAGFFALALFASPAFGQEVRGVVLDLATQAAIGDAEVIIDGGAASTRTTAAGAFAFRVSGGGPHVLTIRRPGFRSLTTEAPATADVVEYALERVPTMLEEVAVRDSAVDPLARGKLNDFYQRRKMGIGTFLLRGVFDDARSPRVAEILSRHVPGLRVVPSPCGLQSFVATTRFSGSLSRTSQAQVCGRALSPAICLVNVLLDGVMVYNGTPGQAPFDVNSLQPGDISAIEYYGGPSRVPVGLNATSGACGLIGIWTR